MSIIDDFTQQSGKIELPTDLYAAIKQYGPLPRYHERECFAGEVCLPYQTGDGVIRETEPAEQDARDLYHHVRVRAISLRESNPNLKPLPKSETDPFVGIQTIQEWCLDNDAEGGNAKDKVIGDAGNGKPKRKSRLTKIELISEQLKANRAAKSKEIEKATGIKDSEVRKLWKNIKKASKESKRTKPHGSKEDGRTEAVDDSKECGICTTPIVGSFWCELCNESIVGECKTCHETNTHTEDAIP